MKLLFFRSRKPTSLRLVVNAAREPDPYYTQHPEIIGGESMLRMEKLTTGIAYGASATNAGYWSLQLLDQVSPSQWAAIGVLGSLVFGLLTYLTNLYFKIKEDRRKAARGE